MPRKFKHTSDSADLKNSGGTTTTETLGLLASASPGQQQHQNEPRRWSTECGGSRTCTASASRSRQCRRLALGSNLFNIRCSNTDFFGRCRPRQRRIRRRRQALGSNLFNIRCSNTDFFGRCRQQLPLRPMDRLPAAFFSHSG